MDAAIEQYAPCETHDDDLTVALPLPYVLHPTCLHMQVRSGSKTKSLIQFAMRKLFPTDVNVPPVEQITWNAFGDGISKGIACAELAKRRAQLNFYEYVQIGYKRTEQIWKPVNSNVELDTLKVNKDIPAICILLSKLPLVQSTEGDN